MCYNNNINIHCEAKCSLSGMYLLFESFYGSCSSFSNEQQTNVTEEVDLKSALFFLSELKYTHSRLKDQFVCGGESVSVRFSLQPLNFCE